MKLVTVIAALFFILMSNALAQSQVTTASPSTDQLQHHVLTWTGEAEISIRELMVGLHAPSGVVFLPESNVERKYKFEPSSLVVRDVLDEVVKVEPEYRWEAQDGVANLLPANKYPAFLDSVIPEFEIKNATTISGFDHLEEMPIFQQQATAFGYSNYTVPRIINESRLSGMKEFSVHCKNATIREVLNAIVRAHGQAVWGFREYMQDGHKFFDLWFVLG